MSQTIRAIEDDRELRLETCKAAFYYAEYLRDDMRYELSRIPPIKAEKELRKIALLNESSLKLEKYMRCYNVYKSLLKSGRTHSAQCFRIDGRQFSQDQLEELFKNSYDDNHPMFRNMGRVAEEHQEKKKQGDTPLKKNFQRIFGFMWAGLLRCYYPYPSDSTILDI